MNYIVKDLMVPISDYATISEGSTFLDALLALETPNVDLGARIHPHWIVLVLDSNEKVVGKLSQINMLRALEPTTEDVKNIDRLSRFGFGAHFITQLRENLRLDDTSIESMYTSSEILQMKVEDFMKELADNDFIDENTSLATAAHQMSVRKRLSMLVTREKEVIGILKLSDVFTAVIHAIKSTTG
ncbi:CBS domain-containing protein [Desulfocicer niacini]